jgi:hypothetical protein
MERSVNSYQVRVVPARSPDAVMVFGVTADDQLAAVITAQQLLDRARVTAAVLAVEKLRPAP